MLTNLPAELRDIIYEYVLVEDSPLLISYVYGSVGISHEQSTVTKRNTRDWGLLAANRRIRHEALCILLSKSHFVCIVDGRNSNNNCDFFNLEVPKGYLHFVKHVSFAVATDEWEEHMSPVDAMLLLNLLFKAKIKLRSLFIVQASCAAGDQRGRYTEMMGANILVPLAVRMLVKGFVDSFYAGIIRNVMGPEEQQMRESQQSAESEDDRPWEPELAVHEVWKKAMVPSNSNYNAKKLQEAQFTVFDAWYTRDPRPPYSVLRSGFEALHVVPRQRELRSQDLMRLHDFGEGPHERRYKSPTRPEQCGKWHGEALLMVEYDAAREDDPIPKVGMPACRIVFRYYIRKNYAWGPTRFYPRIREIEDEVLVDMNMQDFYDMKKAQAWWDLWWPANLKGQQKIDGWLMKIT